jgi:hypothetical protein
MLSRPLALSYKEVTLRCAQMLWGMSSFAGIVAHLIVGRKPERYLGAALDSIDSVCDYAVVNDNSGLPNSENAAVVASSALARTGRLTLVRSAFVDFATARNACLDATPPEFSRAWGLFIDADEVHGNELTAMAGLLPHLPPEIDAVDGYCRLFIGSFSWWLDLQRSRCFVRLSPELRWSGRIHERLSPVFRRIALPAEWFQYGHVVLPREEAEKSLFYSSLGAGRAPTDEQLSLANAASVWGHLLRRAHRFTGAHPPAMAPIIQSLSGERAEMFAAVDHLAGRRTRGDRMRNALKIANARRLVAWRAAEAHLRWRWPVDARYSVHPRAAAAVVHVDDTLDGRLAKQITP